MLRLSNNRVLSALLSLAAMLFIAAGAPLVHPAIHNHLDHEQANDGHCGEHFPVIADSDKGHECPICDFQAENQLHGSGSAPIIAVNEPVGNIPPTPPISPVKVFPVKAEPRAPPRCT
jgi:hypothetical protein